jgi:transposase
MWTPENRSLYNRDKLRYPSDLTEAEWRHIGPLIPAARRGGAKRHFDEEANRPTFRAIRSNVKNGEGIRAI